MRSYIIPLLSVQLLAVYLFDIIISVSPPVHRPLWKSVHHRENEYLLPRCMNDRQVMKHSDQCGMFHLTIPR
jgi:hypothetical protein